MVIAASLPCYRWGKSCWATQHRLCWAGAEVTLQRRLLAHQAVGQLPSLHSLTVGWGFGGGALQILASASEFLTELTAGVGAEVSDWLLARLASACPHLRALRLQFSTVTDSGMPTGRLMMSHCLLAAACL